MNTLTSGVASMRHGVMQWFYSYDVNGFARSLDKSSSPGGFTHGSFVPDEKAEMEEFHKLEKLEKKLAIRYKMVSPWMIDSVAVFNEAKARAFSNRNAQTEKDLRQMGKLYKLRRRGIMKSKMIPLRNGRRSCKRSTTAYVLGGIRMRLAFAFGHLASMKPGWKLETWSTYISIRRGKSVYNFTAVMANDVSDKGEGHQRKVKATNMCARHKLKTHSLHCFRIATLYVAILGYSSTQ
ncbi:hypothetical protein F5146DRAFT_1004944 [Armillaria mellea]|nr:hypothetical protein F5146DRAFT_1004944 [Armillaria mellea]